MGKDAQVSHTFPNSGNDSVQTQKNVSLGLRARAPFRDQTHFESERVFSKYNEMPYKNV